mmetsp:Transcript_21537/g.51403  ORF Transcript_21537/g.51403 Transcript_21537/m.51403 type:complete len:255 (+) Transcript_21537:963-1727(+)
MSCVTGLVILVGASVLPFLRGVDALGVLLALPSVIVDLVLAVEVIQVEVAIKDGVFGKDLSGNDVDGIADEKVPFRAVAVDICLIDAGRQGVPSTPLDADGTKAGISLFVESMLGLSSRSVALHVVNLVDVPIGTPGAAGKSDAPGCVRESAVVVGECQLVESQVLELFGALVFFIQLVRSVVGFVVVVIKCEFLFCNFPLVSFDGIHCTPANSVHFSDFRIHRIVVTVIHFIPIGLRARLNNMWTVEIEVSSV